MSALTGPAIAARSPWFAAEDDAAPATDEQQGLRSIASLVDFKKGQSIYRSGEDATAVFIISAGVTKSYKQDVSGRETIVAFWYMNDLFGLAEDGKYVNSLRAVTQVRVYKIAVREFEDFLEQHPRLSSRFRSWLLNTLVETNNVIALLHQMRPSARICWFLQILMTKQANRGLYLHEVYLPMSRRDISAYLGITPEVLSRSLRELGQQGVISFRNRQHVRIVDQARFDTILAEINRR